MASELTELQAKTLQAMMNAAWNRLHDAFSFAAQCGATEEKTAIQKAMTAIEPKMEVRFKP